MKPQNGLLFGSLRLYVTMSVRICDVFENIFAPSFKNLSSFRTTHPALLYTSSLSCRVLSAAFFCLRRCLSLSAALLCLLPCLTPTQLYNQQQRQQKEHLSPALSAAFSGTLP